MNITKEMTVGIFVLIGLLCTAYLTVKLGRMEVLGTEGYQVSARFNTVAGLRVGASVEMSGVPVGRVAAITLDAKRAQALVTLRLEQGLELSEDTIASIKTSGLIGDKYINLSSGGAEKNIAPGGEISETESAVDLESLIGKYAFGGV